MLYRIHLAMSVILTHNLSGGSLIIRLKQYKKICLPNLCMCMNAPVIKIGCEICIAEHCCGYSAVMAVFLLPEGMVKCVTEISLVPISSICGLLV
jgi:hypothetical protein